MIKYYKDIVITICWISIIFTIFIQNTPTYSSIGGDQQLWFFLVGPVFVIISSMLLWKKVPRYRISVWDLWYCCIFVYIVIINTITPLPSVQRWTQAILLLNCGWILRIWLYRNRLAKRIVIYTLCLAGAIEAVWAILQLWGMVEVLHSQFPLTGSFPNPGPFSGFLAILLPIALHQTLLSREYVRTWNLTTLVLTIPIVSFVIMFLVLPAGFSRTAWLAVLVSCGFFLLSYFDVRKKIIKEIKSRRRTVLQWSVALFIIVITASSIAYHFKRDSADGRFLIWKLSLNAMFEEPTVFGKGLGIFPQEYRKAQINYMKNGNPSLQEKRVADVPEYAFNEYLHIGIEQGFLGLVLYIILLIMLVEIAGRHKRTLGILCSIISFSIFSFASYPMSFLSFWIVLITIPALLQYGNTRMTNKSNSRFYILLVSIVISTLFVSFYRKQNNERRLSSNLTDISLILESDINNHIEEPYTLFKYGKLLFEEAIVTPQNSMNYIVSALKYFNQGEKISCDPMFQVMKGRCYEKLGEFKKAEESYLEAHYMTPNRLYPLYRLALLHSSMTSPETSLYYAKKLLESPVKITSPATNDMKRQMKELIEEQEKQLKINKSNP